jgi:hypothetical protein
MVIEPKHGLYWAWDWPLLTGHFSFLGNQFPRATYSMLVATTSQQREWEVGGPEKGQKLYYLSLYIRRIVYLFCLFLFVTLISPLSHDISQWGSFGTVVWKASPPQYEYKWFCNGYVNWNELNWMNWYTPTSVNTLNFGL